jgi:radical SAM superfamily enzyme YgiQ (UPF0313 family)
MVPDERVERMIEIMEKMTDLLFHENEVIEEGSFDHLEKILEEKKVLMENYDFHIKYLDEHPHMLLDVTPEMMEALVVVGEELDMASQKNELLLRQADEAGQVMIASIAEAATQTSQKAKGYMKDGTHRDKGEQIAVTFNERL